MVSHIRTTHETVGHRFQAFGDVYFCFRYEKRCGFWMRLEKITDLLRGNIIGRKVGEEVCVSERAISRTYHRASWSDEPIAHETPCECYVCEKRSV